MLQDIVPFAVLFFIIGIIAFTIMIAYIVRLWLTQTATFQIQKDIADIHDHILGLDVNDNVPTLPQAVRDGNVKPLVAKKQFEFKRPRQLFIWIAAIAIPVLLIIFIVISIYT